MLLLDHYPSKHLGKTKQRINKQEANPRTIFKWHSAPHRVP
jgi:hypothetical protein